MSVLDVVQLAFVIIAIGVAVALVVTVIDANKKAARQLLMIAEITSQTHTLVNKRYGESLMAQVLLARSVARLTVDPDEKDAADTIVTAAEQAYEDHQAQQEVLDAATQPKE